MKLSNIMVFLNIPPKPETGVYEKLYPVGFENYGQIWTRKEYVKGMQQGMNKCWDHHGNLAHELNLIDKQVEGEGIFYE